MRMLRCFDCHVVLAHVLVLVLTLVCMRCMCTCECSMVGHDREPDAVDMARREQEAHVQMERHEGQHQLLSFDASCGK